MTRGLTVDRYSVSYCLLVLLAGIAVSLLTPVLSLFLSDELGVSSFKVGVYFTCYACAGILVSRSWRLYRTGPGTAGSLSSLRP